MCGWCIVCVFLFLYLYCSPHYLATDAGVIASSSLSISAKVTNKKIQGLKRLYMNIINNEENRDFPNLSFY